MVTKGVIRSINSLGNRCVVRMPLFETASSSAPVEAEAVVSITPGFYSNLEINDVVIVAFEENALEKPVIIGKLFKGALKESETPGGMGILDTLNVRTAATVPCTTLFKYPATSQTAYQDLNTPKKIADYIFWLERLFKRLFKQLEGHFKCFKNWVQWHLKPENVGVDDGDLDSLAYENLDPTLYKAEGTQCKICGNNCTKNEIRSYLTLDTDLEYPNT